MSATILCYCALGRTRSKRCVQSNRQTHFSAALLVLALVKTCLTNISTLSEYLYVKIWWQITMLMYPFTWSKLKHQTRELKKICSFLKHNSMNNSDLITLSDNTPLNKKWNPNFASFFFFFFNFDLENRLKEMATARIGLAPWFHNKVIDPLLQILRRFSLKLFSFLRFLLSYSLWDGILTVTEYKYVLRLCLITRGYLSVFNCYFAFLVLDLTDLFGITHCIPGRNSSEI